VRRSHRLIGPHWLTITDKNGVRRLDDPKDFIPLEILTALKRNVRVIPALVGNAQMPEMESLPDEIKSVARRQAFELSEERWADDTRKLADVLADRQDETFACTKAQSCLGRASCFRRSRRNRIRL
jgi:hypothetical protein